jgi:metal-sulfur cluster biosynthetic enzyme
MIDDTQEAVTSAGAGGVSVDQVKLALRRVKDPDLHLNIIDLGLVYDIAVDGAKVKVDMTLRPRDNGRGGARAQSDRGR